MSINVNGIGLQDCAVASLQSSGLCGRYWTPSCQSRGQTWASLGPESRTNLATHGFNILYASKLHKNWDSRRLTIH
jgi:hypothetical protein